MNDANRASGQKVSGRATGTPSDRIPEHEATYAPATGQQSQLVQNENHRKIPQDPGIGDERIEVDSLSMGSLASMLPNLRSAQSFSTGISSQRTFADPLSHQLMQQQQNLPNSSSFGGQSPNHSQNSGFTSTFAAPLGGLSHSRQGGLFAIPQNTAQSRVSLTSPVQQPFHGTPMFGQQPPSSHYMYYPQIHGPLGNAQGFPTVQRPIETNLYPVGGSTPPAGYGAFPASPGQGSGILGRGMPLGDGVRRPNTSSTVGTIPAAPRGPPRKPKQSGHALWVGNLPPGARVIDLKDHFSKDATKDIESVFLISKSNCAFVNYQSEEACAAAMNRFHESRFQGVRLVCRLRRNPGTASSPGIPTGPAALSQSAAQGQTAVEAINYNRQISSRAEESIRQVEGASKINDKYFIVKSLTLEDLELSVNNGIWATQSHNEDALNRAFENVENVYLIFSANKSGEYFGYARMASPINEEVARDLDWTPRVEAVTDHFDLPRAIPTPATETAPKGQIIDDSARGTIFWEADSSEMEPLTQLETNGNDEIDEKAEEEEQISEVQTFGKPFKIEWLSTTRLPFYRTRGLRNPWNANREVKIARDGTELETSVGRRLVEMFHRPATNMPLSYTTTRPY